MTSAIAHRGPDDLGHIMFDSKGRHEPLAFAQQPVDDQGFDVALGNRRLAIIDLSSLGHQPMTFAGCTIVFNGEVYNYLELADELRSRGHVIKSRSDTEVLLHCYVEWREMCLERLNGIFAFAIWDTRARRLLSARDHLGVKPLYYVQEGSDLLICSEIKGLLGMLGRRPPTNDPLVYDYLMSGRLDHTDETFFTGIRRLKAGHYMIWCGDKLQVGRYWKPDAAPVSNGSFEKNAKTFHDLFHDAIRLQMRSDVPVGCCLSGGLDSSSIVSVAARQSSYQMKTFTARFSERRMDEWSYAKEVHRAVHVNPFSMFAKPQDFWVELPALIRAQEEPFSDPGVFVQWRLMKLIASEGIRVVLDGQGGDELLCGYAKYFYFMLRELVQQRRLLEAGLAAMDGLFYGGSRLFNWTAAQRYLPRWMGRKARQSRLISPALAAACGDREVGLPAGGVQTQQILDITRFSLPPLLRYEDKNSMAFSIESRVPFLDHRLVEFALALPTHHKMRRSESKYVLRRGLKDEVPAAILRRRSKLGFGGRYDLWVQALQPQFQAWLRQPQRRVDRFVVHPELHAMLKRRDVNLFRTLVLDSWMTEFGMD